MTDLNFNQTECIREINNFGSTTYKNICNGTINVVEWGSLEWIGIIVFGVLSIFMLLVFIKAVASTLF